MTQIKTEHNGRELIFREDDESWSCHPMNMKAKTLKALKAKLDKADAQERRIKPIPVITVGSEYSEAFGKGQRHIVLIAKAKDQEKEQRPNPDGGSFSRPIYVGVSTVWVNIVKGNQIERKKMRLDTCIAPTPENLLLIEAYEHKLEQIKELRAEAKLMLEAIPRMTMEEVLAAGAEQDEEDEA